MRVIRYLETVSLVALALAGCDKPADNRLLGYVEGDYVYMALPASGRLTEIAVKRGDRVEAGATLFALDATTATADLDRAKADLAEAEHKLADLKSGERPEELA